MRSRTIIDYILVLIILWGSLYFQSVAHVKSQSHDIPIFDEIIGNQVETGVYSENDLLDVRYSISTAAGGVKIFINGSGYNNSYLNMDYLWRDDTTKYFKFDLQIHNYTIFRAYGTDGVGTIISEEDYYLEDLDISFHRLWTSGDKYPEFVSIDAAVDNVIENVNFEYATSDVALVEYKIKSKYNASLDIIIDRSRNFINPTITQMNYIGKEGEYQIFKHELVLNDRELWFIVTSQNSFEYNNVDPDLSLKRRLHNGFSFNNTRMEVLRDGKFVQTDRITDNDEAFIRFDILNETGNEYYQVELDRMNVDNEFEKVVHNITSEGSYLMNGTTVSSYLITLSPLVWKDQVSIYINSFDIRSTQSIGVVKEIVFIVMKWGVIVEIENPIKYTTEEEINIKYFINDLGDNGLSSVQISVNNISRKLVLDQRDANVTLSHGMNYITINVTNGNGESSYDNIITQRDNINPIIQGMNITKSGSYYRLVANISEIRAFDVGIGTIRIGINGVVSAISVSDGSREISLYEQLNLATGKNTVALEVADLAGNTIEQSVVYFISEVIETENSSNIVQIVIIGVVLITIVTFVIYGRRQLP